MIKIRDEVNINSLSFEQNIFAIFDKENYQIDSVRFFDITKTEKLANNDIILEINLLEEIIVNYNLKLIFLYNQIYENQLPNEINNLIEGLFEDHLQQNHSSESERKNYYYKLNIPNYYNFFYIEIPDDLDEKIVLKLLKSISIINEDPKKYILDHAYLRETLSGETSPTPSSPNANYDYLELMGINALKRSNISGHLGDNITIIDCETGWGRQGTPSNPFPNSLSSIKVINIPNSPRNHGTQVLSILKSTNPILKPLAPSVNFIGSVVKDKLIENSILLALIEIKTKNLNGVILLEQAYQKGNDYYLPYEIVPSVFYALELAKLSNVVVIEPSGNSGRDLDSSSTKNDMLYSWNFLVQDDPRTTPNEAQRLLDISLSENNATIRSTILVLSSGTPLGRTGAILVGAYFKSGIIIINTEHNHGSHVICYAQGENVRSFVYKANGDIKITGFADTSAASAIMAGFVAILQSVYIHKTPTPSRVLSPIKIEEAIISGKIASSIGIPNIMQSINHILSTRFVP